MGKDIFGDNRGLALVSLVLGAAALVILAASSSTAIVPFWSATLAVGLLALWIAAQDLADFTIPDAAVIALAALGAGLRIADASLLGEPLANAVAAIAVDAALCGGLLLGLREIYYRRRGVDGLGFGDVKLGAAGGALAQISGFAWALFAASLAGIVVVVALRYSPWRLQAERSDKVPFGTFLAPALWATWMAGQTAGASALGR